MQEFSEMENNVVQVLREGWMSSNTNFAWNPGSEGESRLRRAWDDAIRIFRQDSDDEMEIHRVLENWLDKLIALHSEPSRHYHTLSHLDEMLAYWQALQGSITDKYSLDMSDSIVKLGIWFHDAIYVPKSGSNEEDSATFYEEFRDEISKYSFAKFDHDRVIYLILQTKLHDVAESDDQVLQLFIDIDMAVLGKNREAYSEYSAAIRKEYIHVPPAIYCEKRAAILESFVNNGKPIFSTSLIRQALEERARDNLLWEIIMLKNGMIPSENVTRVNVNKLK